MPVTVTSPSAPLAAARVALKVPSEVVVTSEALSVPALELLRARFTLLPGTPLPKTSVTLPLTVMFDPAFPLASLTTIL